MSDFETRFRSLAPSAGRLRRDGVLYDAAFAAGRASMRGRVPWLLCALLLLAQVATLVALWPADSVAVPPPVDAAPAPPMPAEPAPPPATPEPNSYVALMRRLGEDRPPEISPDATPDPVPLTPHSRID